MQEFELIIDKSKASKYLIGSLALIFVEGYIFVNYGLEGYSQYVSDTKKLILQIAAVPLAIYSLFVVLPQALMAIFWKNPVATARGGVFQVGSSSFPLEAGSFVVARGIFGNIVALESPNLRVRIPGMFLDKESGDQLALMACGE